ncbi:hypothetical protein TNCV_2171761 [Trichonephila clavipes]|nr:hypothetical protein TNCV_2171761 [Trichonephila clavipes]
MVQLGCDPVAVWVKQILNFILVFLKPGLDKSCCMVIKMVCIVLCGFVICWSPLQVTILYGMFWHSASQHGEDLGLNPGGGMDVCKCIVPSWNGSTINSCRATSIFIRFEEDSPKAPRDVLSQNCPKRTAKFSRLRLTTGVRSSHWP